MERFKVVERETKTKAYSKEGLGAAQKLDPIQKEKDEITNWLSLTIDQLNIKIDQFESEIESLQVAQKKSKKDKEKQDRIEELKHWIEKHRYHIKQLETLMRMLDNDTVEVDQIKKVKDDVEYYVESFQEPDFEDNEFIYEDLDLEDMQQYLANCRANTNHTASFDSGTTKNSNNTGDDDGSCSIQSNSPTSTTSSPVPSPGLTNHSKGISHESNNTSSTNSICSTTVNNNSANFTVTTSISSSSSVTGATTQIVKPLPVWTHSTSTASSSTNSTSSTSSIASSTTKSTVPQPTPTSTINATSSTTTTTATTTTTTVFTTSSRNSSSSSSSSSPSVNSLNNHNPPATPYAVAAATANTKPNQIETSIKSDINSLEPITSSRSTSTPPNSRSTPPVISESSVNLSQEPVIQNQLQNQIHQIPTLYSSAVSVVNSSTVNSNPWNNNSNINSRTNMPQQYPPPSSNIILNGPVTGITPNQMPQSLSSLKSIAQQAVVSAGLEEHINGQQDQQTLHQQRSTQQQQQTQVQSSGLFENTINSINNSMINSGINASPPNSMFGLLNVSSKSLITPIQSISSSSAPTLPLTTGPQRSITPASGTHTSEAHIPPILGAAPLGPVNLTKQCYQQLVLLENAARHPIHPMDSQRLRYLFCHNSLFNYDKINMFIHFNINCLLLRPYLIPNPCPVPNYYPQQTLPNCDSAEFFQRLSTETLFFIFYFMEVSFINN